MSNINFFAKTSVRGQSRLFGIKRGDRRYHIYVIGKTTLLLRHIPNSRAKDVIYFDPADAKNIGLNVLENVEPERSIWLSLFYMM
jgi:hypothetical protein